MAIRGKEPQLNLLELIPEQVADFTIDEDGRVQIRLPRFKNSKLREWLTPRGKKPLVHTRLDEFGSSVWQHCDGKRTVGEIAELLLEQFGEEIQPVYDRVGLFINQLKRYRYIRLSKKDGTAVRS